MSRSKLEILAIVPARGGSKGLPDKNLRLVGNLSLVGRAVKVAQQASLITRVVGSTDSPKIAEEMKAAGADVPWLRPSDLAQDQTPDAPVFRHALEQLAVDGYRPDIIVNVRPTAPLRSSEHIDEALQALIACPEASSVKSVTGVTEHPYKMWQLDDSVLQPLLPAMRDDFGGDPDIARQRLPTVYKSNGAVDAVRVDAFLAAEHFHPGIVAAYVMDEVASIDIDDEADLARASAAISELDAALRRP